MQLRALVLLLVALLLSPTFAFADTSAARALWGSWRFVLPDEQKAQLAEMEKTVKANATDELSKAMLEMLRAVIEAKFEIGDGTISAAIGGETEVATWTATPVSGGVWSMVTTDPEGKVSTQTATLVGDLLTIAEDGGQPMQLQRVGSTSDVASEPSAQPVEGGSAKAGRGAGKGAKKSK